MGHRPMTLEHPPSLLPSSSCKRDLHFEPQGYWPRGLPAVAVNGWILAGFEQDLVFNHEVPSDQSQSITDLFCSLYVELTFAEITRLWSKSKSLSWFPFESIAQHYRVQISPQFFDLAQRLLVLPLPFQLWCGLRKVHAGDLLPLLALDHLSGVESGLVYFETLLKGIVDKQASKSLGVQILELGVELILLGKSWTDLSGSQFSVWDAETWCKHLKDLRNPKASQQDETTSLKILNLPWPGSSQVKWTRSGDQSGIEVKLFVSKPSDLKRYASSFKEVMEKLEDSEDNPWIKH